MMEQEESVMSVDTSNLTVGSSEQTRKPPQKYLVPVVFDKDASDNEGHEKLRQFGCIIGEPLARQPELEEYLKNVDLEVCYSSDGRHMPEHVPDECEMIFICKEFSGPIFDYLTTYGYRVIGPPCLKSCAAKGTHLPDRHRPVYSSTMEDIAVCFTGFREKEHLQELCKLVHWMGGSIRKKMSSNVTHVIAHSVVGAKYKDAVILDKPIMCEQWLIQCWELRNDINVSATSPDLISLKQLPFVGCHIAFHGFVDEEADHVREMAQQNGAVPCEHEDQELTHLLVADGQDPKTIPIVPDHVYVVKQQWFWESIQIQACGEESLYLARERSSSRRSRKRTDTSLHSILEFSLLEASLCSLDSPVPKAQSNENKLHIGVGVPSGGGGGGSPAVVQLDPHEMARHHIVSELIQTEKNFVGILNTIVTVFKEPMESGAIRGGPLLSHEDVKSIFGNIPEILAVHKKILNGLQEKIANWSPESCVGHVLLEQAEVLQRVYPFFVNYFEMTKDTLTRCNKQFPRFHAFLKVNESRPECGRQTLMELLITPVQRIPRIILLLQDLVKHTKEAHPDHKSLGSAVDALKTVMTHINEDKRKTEGQMQMFEVLRDVENCPANVLSSHRVFLERFEATEVTNKGKNKGLPLAVFIFSDSLEITKRRGTHSVLKASTKPYRHLQFLSYSHVRSVVSFSDGAGASSTLGLLIRWPHESRQHLMMFRLSEDQQQPPLIKQLSKLLAVHNCSTMPDSFVVKASLDELHALTKPCDTSSLKKALHGARKKVKRAFSGRHTRRPLAPLSDKVLEEPDDSFTDQEESLLNLSSSSSSLAVTPLSFLQAPRPKRSALNHTHSFSSNDLVKLGVNESFKKMKTGI